MFCKTSNAEILTISTGEFFGSSLAYTQLIEFTRRTLIEAGFTPKFTSLPVERATIENVNGLIDAQMARVRSVFEENPSLKGTSFPIAHTRIRFIYTRQQNNLNENNLNKYTGAISLNSKGLSSQKLKLVNVRNIEQAKLMFSKSRIDYLILPEEIALDLVQNDGFFKNYRVSDRTLLQISLYFILNNKKAHLMPRIEKAFTESLKKTHPDLTLIQSMLNRNQIEHKKTTR